MGNTDRRFRARLLVVILGLVVVLVGGVLTCMELTLGATLRGALRRSVDESAAVTAARLAAELERLAREAVLVVQEPRLRALAATAGADPASIADTLDELLAVARWDAAALLAPDGTILSLRGVTLASPRLATDGLTAVGDGARGYLHLGSRLYRVALASITFGDQVAGRMLIAEEISETLLTEVARATASAVCVTALGQVLAASPPFDGDRRPRALPATAGEIELAGERFLASPVELGGGVGIVVLRSADEAMRPYHRTRRLVWLIGGGAIYAGIILALLLSYRLSRPVTTLQEHAAASNARAERVHLDMQRLMDTMPDAVAVHQEGRLLYANHAMARLTGRDDAGALVGESLASLVHPDDEVTLTGLVADDAAATGIRLRSRSGESVDTEVNTLPVDFGGSHAILTVAHDVRLRRAYEARLLSDRVAAKELELARAIQRETVPTEEVVERGWLRLAGHFEPAAECGGDWWGFHDLGAGRLLLLIGDVTGHGVPSAMITVAARAASDVICSTHGPGLPVERVLEIMNLAIHNAARQRFVMTCFAALFDQGARTLTFANAGHNFPVMCREGEVTSLMARGEPLGQAERITFVPRTIPLASGDQLVLYSDGLPDVVNGLGESFGMRRLRDSVRAGMALDPAALRDRLVDGYRGFQAGAARADDVTFVVVKVV